MNPLIKLVYDCYGTNQSELLLRMGYTRRNLNKGIKELELLLNGDVTEKFLKKLKKGLPVDEEVFEKAKQETIDIIEKKREMIARQRFYPHVEAVFERREIRSMCQGMMYQAYSEISIPKWICELPIKQRDELVLIRIEKQFKHHSEFKFSWLGKLVVCKFYYDYGKFIEIYYEPTEPDGTINLCDL